MIDGKTESRRVRRPYIVVFGTGRDWVRHTRSYMYTAASVKVSALSWCTHNKSVGTYARLPCMHEGEVCAGKQKADQASFQSR